MQAGAKLHTAEGPGRPAHKLRWHLSIYPLDRAAWGCSPLLTTFITCLAIMLINVDHLSEQHNLCMCLCTRLRLQGANRAVVCGRNLRVLWPFSPSRLLYTLSYLRRRICVRLARLAGQAFQAKTNNVPVLSLTWLRAFTVAALIPTSGRITPLLIKAVNYVTIPF